MRQPIRFSHALLFLSLPFSPSSPLKTKQGGFSVYTCALPGNLRRKRPCSSHPRGFQHPCPRGAFPGAEKAGEGWVPEARDPPGQGRAATTGKWGAHSRAIFQKCLLMGLSRGPCLGGGGAPAACIAIPEARRLLCGLTSHPEKPSRSRGRGGPHSWAVRVRLPQPFCGTEPRNATAPVRSTRVPGFPVTVCRLRKHIHSECKTSTHL